jgi:hypothetical protein
MLVTRTPRYITLDLTLLAMFMVNSCPAQGQSFTTIDVPGAAETLVSGINPEGDIVGTYLFLGFRGP